MDRRDFLKSSSTAALAVGSTAFAAASNANAADDAAALASPIIVPARRTLRMVSLWSDAVTGPGDHVRRLAKRIEAATDGRLMIEIADEAVAGADAFKAVMTGEAGLYVGHEHAHRGLHPAFSYFAGLPCGTGMDIDHLNAWLVAAGGQELWDALAAEFNMKGLVIGHSGPPQGLFARQPIRTRDDFKGKVISVDGLAADVLTAIDARPVEHIADPVATVVADTSLDGIELSYPTFRLSREQNLQFRRAAPYSLPPLVGLNNTGYAITLGLRRSLWEGLSEGERITISAVASESLSASRADVHAENVALRQTAPNGVMRKRQSRAPWPRTLNRQLSHIAETIVADLAGHDELTRQINASYMAFKGLVQRFPSV